MRKQIFILTLFSAMGLVVIAANVRSEDVDSYLHDFFKNPKQYINQKPKADYSQARDFEKQKGYFQKLVRKQREERQKDPSLKTPRDIIIDRAELKMEPGEKRAYFDNDRAELILGKNFENNLFKLHEDEKGQTLLMEGIAQTQMGWSNDYWPIAFGSLSMRYVFSRFYNNYMDAFNSYRQPHAYLEGRRQNRNRPLHADVSDDWSPAEKYDLLVGDKHFSLTNALKKEGLGYSDVKTREDAQGNIEIVSLKKDVALWMGKCHGWAAAATVVPRVDRDLTLRGAKGDWVHLHPDDIRGLVTLKWAQSDFKTFYVGGRCNKNLKKGEVKTDPETGAIYDDECFDVNPATFHAVMTNQVGLRERSVVMDATFDDEVWNHPIRHYEIASFFNPETKQQYSSVRDALAPYHFSGDPFKTLRETKWKEAHRYAKEWIAYKNRTGDEFRPKEVVGVVMNVTYLVETQPTHGTPYDDQMVKVTYYYDLELDEEGNMVGGEWYTNLHPDFLWGVVPDERPTNRVDKLLSTHYDGSVKSLIKIGGEKIDPSDKDTPFELSSLENQAPLATVIEYLVEKTR